MCRKIDYYGAMAQGKEAGQQDAQNEARRDPASWFADDFYGAFEDISAALAFEHCYYRAYDQAQKELMNAQE